MNCFAFVNFWGPKFRFGILWQTEQHISVFPKERTTREFPETYLGNIRTIWHCFQFGRNKVRS